MTKQTTYSLPGLVNAHSHAFQRAMAGLAEMQTDPADSFWTWREQMYRHAGLIEPDDLQSIAAQLYVEMLKAGYTAVCEFHYLHHQRDGRPYADAAAMSRALIAAAAETGIDLCLLPVLYMQGGFDGRALSARQGRFGHDTDTFLLGSRELMALDDSTDTEVFSPQSPLGTAIIGHRIGEKVSYSAPNGKPIEVTILEVQPYQA